MATDTSSLQDVLIRFMAESESFIRELNRMENKTKQFENKVGKSVDDVSKKFDRDLFRSLSKIDQATIIHEKKVKKLDAAYKQGIITIGQYKRAIDEEAAAFARLSRPMEAVKKSTDQTTALMATRGLTGPRAMGTAIQQAGYQVGDFAVQVASGQSALRAFIQQGTQLISMFGPSGAILGALLAIGGAVAMAFERGSTESKEAAERADIYAKSLESLESALEKVEIAQKKVNGTYRGADVEAARAEVRTREREEQEALAKAEAARGSFSVDLVRKLLAEREYAVAVERTANARLRLQAAESAASVQIKQDVELQRQQNDYQRQQLVLLRARIIDEDEYNLRMDIRKQQISANVTAESEMGRLIEKGARDTASLTAAEKELLDQRQEAQKLRDKEESAEQKLAEKRADKLEAIRQEIEVRERLNDQLALGQITQRDYKNTLDQMNQARALGIDLTTVEGQEYAKLSDRLAQLDGQYKDITKKQDELAKAGKKAAEDMRRAWDNQAKKMTDSLIEFVETGKGSFKDLVSSMLSDMLRLQLRQMLQPGMNAITGLFSTGLSSLFSGFGFAHGGFVSGPGGPRDDMVPARLSAGEFVVNAQATQRHRALLEAINSGNVVKRFARGGAVSRMTTPNVTNTHNGGDAITINQNWTINGGGEGGGNVRQEVMKMLPMIESRTVRAVQDARKRGR